MLLADVQHTVAFVCFTPLKGLEMPAMFENFQALQQTIFYRTFFSRYQKQKNKIDKNEVFRKEAFSNDYAVLDAYPGRTAGRNAGHTLFVRSALEPQIMRSSDRRMGLRASS